MTADGSVAAGAAVVDALVQAGVAQVVVSPGSRSAPISVAAARRELQGGLQLFVRVDERSAGFLALGMAKASGRPAAVVCTSGTAAANLLPAVVEARYSGVPVVIITADRPPELRGRGASQTIAQVGMFDTYVLGSQELPDPAESADGVGAVAAATRSAVALAARARGPVHLNAPLRAPLVGATPPRSDAPPEPAVAGTDRGAAAPRVDLDVLPPRGAIVAGDIDVWDRRTRGEVAELGARLGWPIVWEATSGLSSAPTAVPDSTRLLADPQRRQRLQAQIVITVGPFGLDRGVLAFIGEADRHIAVRLRPRTDPPDPLGTAERVLDAVPLGRTDPDDEWLRLWRDAAAAMPDRSGPTAEIAAVAEAVRTGMSESDLLVVAPSLAIRAAAAGSGPGPMALANRGVNGIDGVVSTAWGAATVWRGGRTVALLGDLALLHDQNGLLVPTAEERPDLTFVVVDNNGGGIFGQLEQGAAEYADVFERVFGTPHDRDLTDVLRAAAVPSVAADAPAAVAAAVGNASPGVSAVMVRVGR